MEVKLYKVCRACMVNVNDSINISELLKMTDKVVEMFTFCTSIKISEDDGLPSSMCLRCIDNINNCYNFINVCKTTDTNLRYYLTQNKDLETILQQNGEGIKEEDLILSIKEENLFQCDDDDADNDVDDFNNLCDIGITKDDDFSNDDSAFVREQKKKTKPKSEKKLKSKEKLRLKMKQKKSKHKKEFKKVPSDKPFKQFKELKKEYVCPVCESVIVGKRELNLHLAEQHEEYRKYVCNHCKKGFARSHYLTQHLIIHTNERPFACDLCTKTYKQRGQLITHRRLHTKERPYSCDKCGMSFNMKCALVNHSRLHHGDEPNLCHLCGASFAQVGNLVVHMRVHTGEKPYACTMCPFRCSVQSGMRRHERTHANERAHVCSVCQKGFNNSSSLSRHLRIHTGELPYKCDYCSKAFIDNWKRKNHLVKAHNISLDMIPRMIPGRKRTYVKKEIDSSTTENHEQQIVNQS